MHLLSVALDAQGMERAYPWIQEAAAEFPSVLDQENMLGQRYGFKAVPVGIYFDETGRMVKGPSAVDIRQEETWQALATWIKEGYFPASWSPTDRKVTLSGKRTAAEEEADARFHLATVLLKQGKREQSLTELHKAAQLDPENWIIRKQLWALEHPEKFYQGAVDYDWQRAQREREDRERAQL